MGKPVALDRIGQRLDHCILTDQFGKFRRPVFARQHPIGLRRAGGGLFGCIDTASRENIL